MTLAPLGEHAADKRPITVRTGEVLATGTVVHRTRRTATTAGQIVAAETGKLLVTATSTLLLGRA